MHTLTADQLTDQVRHQLQEAGDLAWQRYPLPTAFPSFRNALRAAENALSVLNRPVWLVMRDPCLRPMREAALRAGRQLIMPTRDGQAFIRIPANALSVTASGSLAVHRLIPLPPGSTPYRGPIDVVVVGCHAFEPARPRLLTFDTCHTQHVLDEWRDGLPDGWRLGAVTVVALASDAQQVSGWPMWAEGHAADLVVTPTRVIALRTGEQAMLPEHPTMVDVDGLTAPNSEGGPPCKP